jgi:hypothetical protein
LPPRGGAALALEDSVTTPKSLMMVSALLVGGAGPFCATANELPDIGGWPPVAAAPDGLRAPRLASLRALHIWIKVKNRRPIQIIGSNKFVDD